MVHPHVFRGNDIRGIYGSDGVNEDLAYALGRCAPSVLRAKRVYIARDGRSGSESLRQSLVQGLLDQGISVTDGGLMDTCQFYYSCHVGSYDAGFMVTASHNPKEHNGIKIVGKHATPITLADDLALIRDACVQFSSSTPESLGNLDVKRYTNDYISYVHRISRSHLITPKKIIVDGSNGMGSLLIQQILSDLPLQAQFINTRLDGNFPGHTPNPLDPKACLQLQEAVVSSQADLGIIFDGDADRVAFCDEKGAMVRGDIVTGLLGSLFLEEHSGEKVMFDSRSGDFSHELVEQAGGFAEEAPVGHSFIVRKMIQDRVLFGGEISGHYYYTDNGLVADGAMIACLQFLVLMSRNSSPASQLHSGSSAYHTILETNYSDICADNAIAALTQAFSNEALSVSELDGISMRFIDWHFNLRGSQTESTVRLMIESPSEEILNEKKELVETIIGVLPGNTA